MQTTQQKNQTWYKILDQVKNFVRLHNKLPSKYGSSDSYERRLSHWRFHNKSLLNRGLLQGDRANAFIEAGLTIEPADKWQLMLKRTTEFVRTYGRFPSRNGVTGEERATGKWRTDQNGYLKKNLLSEERKNAFIDAGLCGTIFNQNWNETLKKVVQFRKEHGFLPRTSGDSAEEIRLAVWCSKNRKILKQEYPREKNRRITLINAAGVSDNNLFKSRWQGSYNKLLEFCEKNDRLPAYDSVGEERTIYGWFTAQKIKLNSGSLSSERAEKINSICNRYRPAKLTGSAKWNSWYSRLSVFIERQNRLPVYSKKGTAEEKLAIWLQRQRWLIQNGRLPEKERKLLSRLHDSLSDLTAWVRPREEKDRSRWESKFQDLHSYVKKNGYMPRQHKDYPDETRMYYWFLREYNRAKAGLLKDEQAARIIQLREMVAVRKPGPMPARRDSNSG